MFYTLFLIMATRYGLQPVIADRATLTNDNSKNELNSRMVEFIRVLHVSIQVFIYM